MTTCERYAEAESAERYVAGRMTADETAAFEQHFLACDACLETVRGIEDVRDVLGERRAAIARGEDDPLTAPGLSVPGPSAAPLTRGQRKSFSWTNATWLAVAAALIAVVGWTLGGGLAKLAGRRAAGSAASPAPSVARNADPAASSPSQPSQASPSQASPSQASRPGATAGAGATGPPPANGAAQTPAGTPGASPSPAAPDAPAGSGPTALIARLAIVTPPPYVAVPVRGDADNAQQAFAAAMTRYRAGDYGAAATALRALVTKSPDLASAQFYLGICELMTRQTRRAETALKAAADSDVTPYADEAYFYLAKAALQRGDLTAAERALTEAVVREAGPGQEANRILEEVRALGRS